MSPSIGNFKFPWEILRVVLDGISILDVPRLEVKTIEEATAFIAAYGFDPSNADDMALLWRIYDEAVSFIEKSLSDSSYPRIPDHLRSSAAVNDLRRLLLLASEPTENADQVYACALLRVMHTLIHLTHDPRLRVFDHVQNQILSRLDSHLYVDSKSGATYLGKESEGGIKLVFFKKKDSKDREREIIKLLHKADNLVEEIYDRIGFRLVTETKFAAVRAVRLLLEKNIISIPNVRPGRSRNRLVDFSRVRFEVDRIDTHLRKNEKPAAYIDKLIRRLERRISPRRSARSLINPYTSEHYRAIQFTCRELIKIPNSLYNIHSQLTIQLENIHGGKQLLNEVFPELPRPYDYVFFPYEIQIMDVKAYADSIFGKSNHEEYRRKQLQAARNRVFGRSAEV